MGTCRATWVLGELKLFVQNRVAQLACRIKGVLQSAQKAILGGMNSASIITERLNYSTSNENSIYAGLCYLQWVTS